MLRKKTTKIGKTYATTFYQVPSKKEIKKQQRNDYKNHFKDHRSKVNNDQPMTIQDC